MKKSLCFLALVFGFVVSNAQVQCLTESPAPPQWIFNKSAKSLQISSSYTLNIFIHIIRSSSGQGLGTDILPTIMSSLNSNFQSANIQFSLLGSEFIDNDYYYIDFSGKESQLFLVNSHCNAIDIYILGQSTSWGAAGLAEDIPSTALIVQGNYYNTSSLPHEMGHCLGLYHTHHGTVNEGGGDTNQCAELVDGSNATTCGDYISDTPADPDQWSSNSCNYVGIGTDANGDSYSPDVQNLMSYAYKPCRTTFSNLQDSRMIDFINNTLMLQNTFASSFSGPTTVCSSGATYTLSNLPPVDSIIWSCGPNLAISSGQNSDNCIFYPTSNGSSFVSVRLVTACGSITLPQKTVWAGIPPTPTRILGFATTGQEFGSNTFYDFSVSVNPLAVTNYSWDVDGGTIVSGQGTSTITVLTGTTTNNNIDFSVGIRLENDCGLTSWFTRTGWVVPGSGGAQIIISPNPATDETTIELIPTKGQELPADTTWDLQIYDSMQSLKTETQKVKGNKQIISTSNWKDGVYIVRANYNGKILTNKLVVKH